MHNVTVACQGSGVSISKLTTFQSNGMKEKLRLIMFFLSYFFSTQVCNLMSGPNRTQNADSIRNDSQFFAEKVKRGMAL